MRKSKKNERKRMRRSKTKRMRRNKKRRRVKRGRQMEKKSEVEEKRKRRKEKIVKDGCCFGGKEVRWERSTMRAPSWCLLARRIAGVYFDTSILTYVLLLLAVFPRKILRRRSDNGCNKGVSFAVCTLLC